MLVYKVVETSTVTDQELERLINEWVPQGWGLDGIRFVVREASRRPAMAFVTFTREAPDQPVAPPSRRKKIP
jgi:hypothetical protein